MTKEDLLSHCDSLNDARGRGGKSRLARKLGWSYPTMWRKLTGKSEITPADAALVREKMGEP